MRTKINRRLRFMVAAAGCACIVVPVSAGWTASGSTAAHLQQQSEDESSIDAKAIKDGIEAAMAVGKLVWDLFNSQGHPEEKWTGNQLQLPVRHMTDQVSRVSNNIHKVKFEDGVRVCRFRWAEGTVKPEDARRTKVTFMADKAGRRDRPRSLSVRAGELFVMATPTSKDRNYYVGRLDARGGSEEFTARNPSATLVLEVVPASELNGVLLAEHQNFRGGGRFVQMGARVGNLGSMDFNDAVSSIRCYGKARLEAFEHTEFRGHKQEFTGSNADIHGQGWGDRISSCIVR